MKIFIIGSSGLLGSNILNKLKNNKNLILHHNGLRKRKIDLTNFKKIKNFLIIKKFDLIINCAAYTDIDFIEKNKKKTNKLNIELIRNLFLIKKKYKLSYKVMHFSTDQMYGYKNVYHSENSKFKICNHYTKQKILSEKICKKNNSLIFRVNFFGKSVNKSKNNKLSFTDWIYKMFLRPDQNFHLFEDVYFNPMYVGNLAQIIAEIVKKNLISFNGIFNIGSKNGMNKKDFAVFFAKRANIYNNNAYMVSKSYKILNAKRSRFMMMNTKKFEKKFQIKLGNLKNEIKTCAKKY